MSDWWARTPDGEHSDVWRWNRAQREAERSPAPDLRPAFRRFVLVEVPGLLMLGVGLAVAVALLRGRESDVWLAARWGLLAAVLGMMGFGLVHLTRSLPGLSNVLGVLSPAQRGRVQRQLRGAVTVAPHELVVTRAAARERQAAMLRLSFTFIPMGFLDLVQAANPRNDSGLDVIWVVLIAAVVAAAVVAWWQYRRAAVFLRMHPESSPSAVDGGG
ncbi:hypothetical protein V6N00_03385 [Tersicoccus sp. MR15.9]|uniref:hypothetical protein n=1 Tax=Tersicoccus mangrovi TaxID=3121635 RepID=UPI002FE61953